MMSNTISDQHDENTNKFFPPIWTWQDLLIISLTVILIIIAGAMFLTLLTPDTISANPANVEITLGYSAGLAAIEAFAILILSLIHI